ncbi:translation initiation factor IF-2 [Coprococcus comes]|uniref:translation initiation factor IF-2 n=1 Tax=Coprococcus TaxID=33042 RepID=UPI001C02B4B6|nr:translation initiation factor IF-2 [Coprococcus comes]MBT9780650.1 translation initiation factor IF-2 [Coprococcus comes]
MAKLRVYELAEQMNKTNKEILSILKDKGIEVASHMSTLSDEQIDAVKSEKTSEDTPKKKNIVQVFRPQNSQGGGRGRNGQGRQQGSRNGQRSQGNGNGQGRPQGNGNRQERPQNGNSQGRPQGNGQGRPQNGNRQERPQGNGNGQGRPQNGNRQDRPQGENRDNRQRRNPNGPRNSQDQRQGRPGDGRRDGGFQNRGDRRDNRDNRDNRDGREMRDGGRRDDRRKSSPSIPAPAIAEQKPSRNKPKDAHKKKEYNRNEENEDRLQKGKKGKNNNAQPKMVKPQPKKEVVEEQIKQITIPEVLTIQELADAMKIQPSVIVKKLFMQGKIVTVNQEIDYETAEEIALEFDVLCEKEEVVDVIEELLKEDEEDEKKMKKRPPVVCVMGHVDHGKTSLLDKIRDTHVIAGEAGGITQHIGASVVEINGEKITFLDTPGHEAFTAMRMRGANSTDIAILVVAADDGVMPQTVEAINHAKAAGIEIVVAINKIDKPSANIDRVKQELTEYELIPEDWGGSTICVPVSAHTGEGIKELLEMVLLTAEVMELKANPNRRARGLVIEAELDKGKGPVATVLVQKGTLRVGDPIAAGSAYGKVRAMMDDQGRRVKEAGPSMPVEILGLNDVPNAGEVFVGCKNDKDARSFAETFISQNKIKKLEETKSKMSLDDLFNQIQEGNLKELGIVVKADVQGSVEAIKQSLVKLSNEEVVVKIIHGGVGAINESDVTLAAASNAIIIGFNVRPDATAKETAEREGVDVRLYRVIYNAIEDVEAAMKGMLEPVFEEKVLGHAEVRQTFKASGVGTIAGSYVLDGTFERDCQARIVRDGVVIYDGKLASLKRFKDDVKEVKAGYECGFVFERFNDVKEGDQVEAFKMVEVPR